jgi:hypothetical protein
MRSFTAFCTFIEGAHFDLAHTLARHAEFAGKLFERDRLVGQPPRSGAPASDGSPWRGSAGSRDDL